MNIERAWLAFMFWPAWLLPFVACMALGTPLWLAAGVGAGGYAVWWLAIG